MASTSNTPERRPRRKPAPRRLPADLTVAVAAALDKKAVDLVVLDLRGGSAFTDAFVICTGASARQVQAIADGIEAALKKVGQRPALVEGYARAEWVLLDYFDFLVHIFTPATRTFYDLERLWGDAKQVEISVGRSGTTRPAPRPW
jgi:ribosome-associated protein